MHAIVFAHDGQCGYCGTWTTITSARSLDAAFFEIPANATYYFHYTTGGTHAFSVGEQLVGGTSSKTCYVAKVVIENGGTAGSGDAGILFVYTPSGTFTAGETLTGQTDSGTCVLVQTPLLIRNVVKPYSPKSMLISVETAGINFTIDGTTPSLTAGANHGHLVGNGQSTVIRGSNNIKNFKAINAVNASGAVMKYSLYY